MPAARADRAGVITPLTATDTLERARTALQNGKGAGLPELLKIIETISTNLAEVTIQELAELIEKDAAVLARIVQIANTIVHNPSFTPLSSLTHAIHQIGFTRVRSLTLSIMLIENAGARNPPEQREAAAQALTAGLLAQGCAQKFGYVDPETAFACAALRNFGQIILPAVSIEHYREALLRLKDKPEDLAFRGMFGVTPLELSRRLLAGARLPEDFMRALRDVSPESLTGTASLPETRLLAVADLGSRIARLALDAQVGADRFAEESRSLARRFRRVLPDAVEYLPAALEHTDTRLAGFLRADGVAALPTVSLNRIRARVQHAPPDSVAITPSPPEAGPVILALGAEAPLAPAIPLEAPPAAPLEIEIAAAGAAGTPAAPEEPSSVTASVETVAVAAPVAAAASSTPFETAELPEPPPAARDPWLAALALVRDSFGAQECWSFTLLPGGNSLPLTHGLGARWQKFQALAAVRADERTVFGVCLSRREAVVIHDLHDAKLKPYLPAWMRETEGAPPSFVLIPLADGDRASGVVLIGWHRAQRIALNKAQLELARQLLGNAAALRPSAAA